MHGVVLTTQFHVDLDQDWNQVLTKAAIIAGRLAATEAVSYPVYSNFKNSCKNHTKFLTIIINAT